MHLIGDVTNCACLIVDDMVDTTGTLCKPANASKEQGPIKVVSYRTHPVLSGNTVNNINNSSLDTLVLTNTISLKEKHRIAARFISFLSPDFLVNQSDESAMKNLQVSCLTMLDQHTLNG